jgi:hypothetical protein
MKEFRPSADFVSKIMKKVYDYEDTRELKPGFSERLFASRLFRYAMSGGGIFVGIFFSPLVCI